MNKNLDNERIYSNTQLIKKIFVFLKPYIKYFVLSLVLILVAVGLELIIPFFYKAATNEMWKLDVDFPKILLICLGMAGITILASATQFIEAMVLQHAGQGIIYNVRNVVFNHIENSSIEQINAIPIGKLVTRVTNDTNSLNELFTDVLVNLIRSVVTIIGVIIFMFVCDVHLASYMLIIMPIILVSTFIFDKYARKAYRKVRHNLSHLNASLSENLSGMKITQAFNAEQKQYKEFKERNRKLQKSSSAQILLHAIYRPSMYVCYIATLFIVFWFGGKDALELAINTGDLSGIGTLLAFYLFIDKFFGPLQELAEQLNTLQSAFASSERIFEILDTPSTIEDKEDGIELEDIRGEIEFKNVWFAYEEGNWILKDVSFHVAPNEVVAFVGATGSGKTTILQLIVRNYDIQKGEILIDGINIKDIKLHSLRSKFGQMLQDVFLFSGTIKDNIKMYEENITDEQVYEACKYVGADHFIERLDNKYDEVVRERGNNFSSGQRQLLSFARTLVHNPNIIILDEATANIDTETEVLIQESLEKMMSIGTMLMVAHRLSTIQHADKIIVLSKGVIQEMGSHQELLKAKGQYYKLYTLQYEKNIHLED